MYKPSYSGLAANRQHFALSNMADAVPQRGVFLFAREFRARECFCRWRVNEDVELRVAFKASFDTEMLNVC